MGVVCDRSHHDLRKEHPGEQRKVYWARRSSSNAVLLDYEMPGISGHVVAAEIKRVRPELPVVLLSGTEVPTQALALVDAFVPKLEALLGVCCSAKTEVTNARASPQSMRFICTS